MISKSMYFELTLNKFCILLILFYTNISFLHSQDTTSTFKDIDGNIYKTIKIGDMLWSAENLKVTHYQNGDSIRNVTDKYEWSELVTGAYCKYDNNDYDATKYGYLYNWYAVNDMRNISPKGWHVPTDDEFTNLYIYLGISKIEADSINLYGVKIGGKLKESGTSHWESPNTGATNESGFSALPGGYRLYDGSFDDIECASTFWTSSNYDTLTAWEIILLNNYSLIHRGHGPMQNGSSIRLVRDN
jgi:uncharacterized protein (TIGR02145 family)